MSEERTPYVVHGPCPCCGTEWETHEHVPPCPPIAPIRAAAKEVGYAIGVHGSLKRDFDLIAAPWTGDAVGYAFLISHLLKRLPELLGKQVRMLGHEAKPRGRHACTLQIDGWMKHIDLSIMPMSDGELYEISDFAEDSPNV